MSIKGFIVIDYFLKLLKTTGLSLAFCALCGALLCSTADAKKTHNPFKKIGHSIEHTAHAAEHGVEHAGKAAEHGAESAGKSAGKSIEKGAKTAGKDVEKGASKGLSAEEKKIQKVVTKVIDVAQKEAAAVAKQGIDPLLKKMGLPTLKTLMEIIENAPGLAKDTILILQKLEQILHQAKMSKSLDLNAVKSDLEAAKKLAQDPRLEPIEELHKSCVDPRVAMELTVASLAPGPGPAVVAAVTQACAQVINVQTQIVALPPKIDQAEDILNHPEVKAIAKNPKAEAKRLKQGGKILAPSDEEDEHDDTARSIVGDGPSGDSGSNNEDD